MQVEPAEEKTEAALAWRGPPGAELGGWPWLKLDLALAKDLLALLNRHNWGRR
jgi:8-oxo-dGTP pyrophosphatase MutT (NUDIX family)